MSALLRFFARLLPARRERAENGCVLDGHPVRVVPYIEGNSGRTYGPFLICDQCQVLDTLEAEPPTGHPDSMTRELAPEIEQELAALDRELFPQEAI